MFDKPNAIGTLLPIGVGLLLVGLLHFSKGTTDEPINPWTPTAVESILQSDAFVAEARTLKEVRRTVGEEKIEGVVVHLIHTEGLFGQIGLEVGDFVYKINGTEVKNQQGFVELIRQFPFVRSLEIQLLRKDEPLVLNKNL